MGDFGRWFSRNYLSEYKKLSRGEVKFRSVIIEVNSNGKLEI